MKNDSDILILNDLNSESIITFIEDYKGFSKSLEHERFKNDEGKISNLLSEFKVLYKEFSNENKKIAKPFNVFKILKIRNIERLEEETHSPILANLLDVTGTHSQENLFYDLFLEELNLKGIQTQRFIPENYSYLFVELEKHTTYGNIDILITNRDEKNKFAICIENKIGASDQEDQLKRYHDYLYNSPYRNNFILVYLTISGYTPSNFSIETTLYNRLKENNLIACLSYKESILNMLIKALENIEAIKVKGTIAQYIEILKSL